MVGATVAITSRYAIYPYFQLKQQLASNRALEKQSLHHLQRAQQETLTQKDQLYALRDMMKQAQEAELASKRLNKVSID